MIKELITSEKICSLRTCVYCVITPGSLSVTAQPEILNIQVSFFACIKDALICPNYSDILHTRVLQKVLSLGSDYFSATFYQT